MVLPIGKYAGYSLDEVPTQYLTWFYEHVDTGKFDGLTDALRNELYMRFNIRSIELDADNNPNVKRIYKELCKLYHPDAGGNTQAMQAINEFYQKLKNL